MTCANINFPSLFREQRVIGDIFFLLCGLGVLTIAHILLMQCANGMKGPVVKHENNFFLPFSTGNIACCLVPMVLLYSFGRWAHTF